MSRCASVFLYSLYASEQQQLTGMHSCMTSLAPADRILISHVNLHMIQAWQAVRFFRGSVRNLLRLFFGDSRGLLSTMAKHPLLQRSPSALPLVTSGFEPPEVERNIGPEHDNEVHTFLCSRGREVGMGSLSQESTRYGALCHLSLYVRCL